MLYARASAGTPAGPPRCSNCTRQRARPLLAQPQSYWYSTRAPAELAARIARLADDRRASIAFWADLAPDLLVPWRHPTLTIVYSSESLTLDDAGMVPAESRADASVILRSTSDRTLLAPATQWPSVLEGVPLTDPVQQWWNLIELGSDDRHEAADRLRRAVLDRTVSATAGDITVS